MIDSNDCTLAAPNMSFPSQSFLLLDISTQSSSWTLCPPQSWEECTRYFGVDEERGLSQSQVEENKKKYGPNGELHHATTLWLRWCRWFIHKKVSCWIWQRWASDTYSQWPDVWMWVGGSVGPVVILLVRGSCMPIYMILPYGKDNTGMICKHGCNFSLTLYI